MKGFSYPIDGLFRMTLPMDFDNPYDQLSPPSNSSSSSSSLTTTTSNSNSDIARMYFVFHLRPGDYHRVHSPRDTKITKTIYVPGLLYPTTHSAMRWLPNLIMSNERILSFGYSYYYDKFNNNSKNIFVFPTDEEAKERKLKKKLTAMALVGATCVGKIITTFDQRIVTNLAEPPETTVVREYKKAAPIVKQGDEVAYFQWGSCVVLVADVERKNLEKNGGKLCLKPGDEVKVGQRLL